MVGTGELSCVLWCKFHDTCFFVHLTINIFIFDFGLLQAKLHFLQKRQENAITWSIFVTVTVAGELCKLAGVTGPEFPHPYSPVRRCLPATGRCRAAV